MSPWDNVDVLATGDGELESKVGEPEQDKFRVKNYIPQRYYLKYRNYFLIAAAGVVALVVFILVSVLSTNVNVSSKIYDNDALSNIRGKLVLLTNDTKLLQFNPKNKNSTLIFESNEPIVAFDVHRNQSVYWTEVVNNTSTRLKVLSNGNSRILIDDPRFEPRAMILDHFTENLYVLDENAGNLVVMNIRTGQYVLLMTELVRPHDLVLDPEEGLMFILQLSDSILRANMDGTDVRKLVSNSGVTSLTVDPKRKRLHWITDFVNIESSDYDGNHRQLFFSDTVMMNSLTILDDRLYWFWPSYDRSSSLLSCKISANDTCEDYESHTMSMLGDPKYIKGYPSLSGVSIENPCKLANGGCQHLCLLNSKNARSCVCGMGWQLNPDKRSCREVRDFLLYPQGGFIRAKSIDGSGNDVFWPTPCEIDNIDKNVSVDFDYDLVNDNFYWNDDYHIYKMKLKRPSVQTKILSVNSTGTTIQDMAFDWYTGNIYFVKRSMTFQRSHSIMLFNERLGETYQKTLHRVSFDSIFGVQACPYALVLHPANHSIFFTTGENNRRYIQHATMNATSVHRIYNTFPRFIHDYRLIAVDYLKNRIYWIWDSDKVTLIKHANFDSTDMKIISIDEVGMAKTIYVHQQWLYISNLTSIWRVHKETGNDAVRITPKFLDDKKSIAGVRVISQSVQFSGKSNLCAENTSICEQFCLNDGGLVCDCKDGMAARGFKCF